MIELYINNRLCDVGRDFGVRLNRQLLKPDELNAKDAQYSYNITLPPTSNNHVIFNYANIEETKDKFNREYRAELIINSVRVFVGLFRLSEVTRDKYKGNLYIPAAKSIKDIFGDLKLAEASLPDDPYIIGFSDFVNSVNTYNNAARLTPQRAIFPYVMYGVLPKVPDLQGSYSDRSVWDDSVRAGVEDFPPSLRVLPLLEYLFKSRGYKLRGTALDDERLTQLYVSYKNDASYAQPWNWGDLSYVKVAGNYASIRGIGTSNRIYERQLYNASTDDGEFYTVNLFDSNNVTFTRIEDTGANHIYKEEQSEPNDPRYIRKSLLLTIPQSGLYKIRLKAKVKMYRGGENERYHDPVARQNWINTRTERDSERNNYFGKKRYEIQVLRDFKTGDLKLSNRVGVGSYFMPNQYQNTVFNNGERQNYPKWFPPKYGKIFVDASTSENFLIGLKFGKTDWDWNAGVGNGGSDSGGPMAIKNGKSRDSNFVQNHSIVSASKDAPLWRYYGPAEGEEDTELPGDDKPLLAWENRQKYGVDITGIPSDEQDNFYYDPPAPALTSGGGQVSSAVWLDKGEVLTIAFVSEAGDSRRSNHHTEFNWGAVIAENIDFELEVKPFKIKPDWVAINDANVGLYAMDWSSKMDFQSGEIDLAGFLPTDMKTDDFIDNFCKAFNLQLTQIDADTFELNVKQSKIVVSNRFISLDNLASVRDRSNTPLGLPSLYKLGFTVDKEEEGYAMTGDDGGGEFSTDVIEEKIIEQKSSFSYNWFKGITKEGRVLPIPVISKAEVWAETMPYPDALKKRYTNQALRFWYYDGLLNDLGVTFNFNGLPLSIAKVSNELPWQCVLNYKNQKLTILDNYFTLLINGSSHYTEVEGYLTPVQYEALNGSTMAMFNGDLYYAAELSSYDPTGRNKTKIKLIRKI